VLPAASLNLTTVFNFQPVGGGCAAINGDFNLIAPEVEKVIQALRAGNIQIVELHNHGLREKRRLFYHPVGRDDLHRGLIIGPYRVGNHGYSTIGGIK
jgi:Domain of Unknown Function (DUF1259)